MENTEYSKANPFHARLVENRQLNKPGSAKDTRHLVVDIAGSGLAYESGDSLGVFPENHPDSVDALLKTLGCSGDEPLRPAEDEPEIPFREALTKRFSLASPTKKFLQVLQEKSTDDGEKARLEHLLAREQRDEVKEYLANREFEDLLAEFPSVRFEPAEFVTHLRKLVPRLYSIASSPRLYPESVHLTVAVVKYQTNERQRYGVASTYLAERCPLDEAVLPVYVASSHFRLPEDPDTDIIMVGPGTGIAPFRAFLQDRSQSGGKGRNWLFFGDQHAATDFLYEEDFREFQEMGALDRLDLAFSRDQDFKIYVQDRIREQGARFWEWLENGAAFYVCGDASRMAKDVDQALLDIIREHGGLDADEAKNYVRLLRKEKRYQRDVY